MATKNGVLVDNISMLVVARVSGFGGSVPSGKTFIEDETNAIAVGATAQEAQSIVLDTVCAAEIVANFTSAALGDSHTYPATETDQRNLIGAAASTAASALWCADASGSWAFVPHTQAQALAVLAAFNAVRNAAQSKLVSLKAQLVAATTVDAVFAIKWS